jgi:hypothetical protein
MRVRKKEADDLLTLDDALGVLSWSVAERYRIVDDVLYADGPPKWTSTKPLTESDLFLSFARLGAGPEAGKGPSQKRVLRWVEKYGLLERGQTRGTDEDDLGAPIRFDAFETEVRKAHRALTLLEAIRGDDVSALRPRVSVEPEYRPDTGELLRSSHVLVDGERIPYLSDPYKEFSDSELFHISEKALEYSVVHRLRGKVWPSFGMNVENPRPPLSYRPRLVWRCEDLLSALWYQFALLIVEQRPWRTCEGCGRLFLATRKDKKVCDASCRKSKLRKLRKGS